MPKRKICVVTGTRAEFGLLEPVMREIKNDKKLNLAIAITGMHLMKEHGLTYREVIKAFPKNYAAFGPGLFGDPVLKAAKSQHKDFFRMALDLGVEIKLFADYLDKENPDVVLVLGDRVEALAGTVTAAYSGICVAHIHGGDVSRGGLERTCYPRPHHRAS